MTATSPSEILFVRKDGLFAVANVFAGKLVLTQSGTNAATDWTHVVAIGNEILLVRNDGLFAVANISAGKLVLTQSGTNAATDWTHVVAIGNEILFVRNDGLFAVANISAGKLVLTQSGTNAATDWTHVVAIGNEILLVRNDGLFAVANISAGKLVLTLSGTNAATDWTHVVAIGNEILFVRNDGLFAVANISAGKLVLTQSGTNAATDWTHVVAIGNEILLVRNDGLFAVANISAGKLVLTQSGTNAATDWTHVVAIGNEILLVRNDGLFAVANISAGKLVLTQSGTNAATDWTHVVATPGAPSSSAQHASAATITKVYEHNGGRLGPLGFPVQAVRVQGGGYSQAFQGGDISILDNGAVEANQRRVTTIRFKGLHCFGAQQGPGSDDPYVIVGIYPPGKRELTLTTKFPSSGNYEGIDSGSEVVESQDVMTARPPEDLVVYCLLMEHDSGDEEKVRQAVKDALDKGASALEAAAGVAVPADWVNVVTAGAAGLITSALGLGDDVIGAYPLTLSYEQLEALARQAATVHHQGAIDYTHETTLLTDGDASYKCYFEIFTEIVTRPLPAG